MEKSQLSHDFDILNSRRIVEVSTLLGYMQVLEYILQDSSLLHVVQWHKKSIVSDDSLPIAENKVFFRAKDDAFKYAYEIGKNLLQQF